MEFFNSAVGVLQTLVIALGAGLGIWGVINLLEGYGQDNPASNAHVRYLVTVQTDRDLSFIELDHLRFSQEVTADGYYIVYSWGKGIELYEMLDMRGH